MTTKIKVAQRIAIIVFCVAMLFVFMGQNNIKGATTAISAHPTFKTYQFADNTNFVFNASTSQSSLAYGSTKNGNFSISCDSIRYGSDVGFTVQGVTYPAYGVVGTTTFNYSFTSPSGNSWSLSECNSTSVNGQATNDGSSIGTGAVLIETSTNGQTWDKELLQTNILSGSVKYTLDDADIKVGKLYRVTIAYEIKMKTGTTGALWWEEDTYDYKECAEVSTFYVCTDVSSVVTRDFMSEKKLLNGGEATYGIRIDKGGSNNLVNVVDPSGTEHTNVKAGASFYAPGKYKITEKTRLGKEYTTNVNVIEGLKTELVDTSKYQTEDNTGYNVSSGTKIDTSLSGNKALSSLKVAVANSSTLKTNGKGVYGATGSVVYFMLNLNTSNLGSWAISDDTWGKIEGQMVNGIITGEVASGALIIQKSSDGKNWEFCKSSIYSDGVFTTDYANQFGKNKEICFYLPAGEDVINGTYYRISYAYEVYNISDTSDIKNYIEVYDFRLCSDNLGAVVFHNLTLQSKDDAKANEDDASTMAIYKQTETLLDGSVTTTGFKVDTSLNPSVSVSILKNGKAYTLPANKEVKDDGKYEITLTSAAGSTRTLTIYVSTKSGQELYSEYFGEKLIDGKRIFSKGEYPVYEGGYTKYVINPLSQYSMPLWGYIQNQTTGTKVDIKAGSSKVSVDILEAGEYIVVLNTNATFATATPSGDNHSFTFKFKIIEKGTAPGPVVNKESLQKFDTSAIGTNAYPIYYGVTFQSAGAGYITLAFATESDAFEFAYQYAKGMVEVQEDGSYRYDGTLIISQKVKYESAWDLTDAVNFFASQSVKKCVINMSDEFTYLTLEGDVISSVENLRTLELSRSVVVFANEEAKDALLSKTKTPIINDKKYANLQPVKDGEVEKGTTPFVFVKDKYGCDSNTVSIIGPDGKTYAIEYNVSVEKQLKEQGCPTGKITIKEKTIYGDETTYEAIFFAQEKNHTTLNLMQIINNEYHLKEISFGEKGFSTTVNGFQLKGFADALDPYGIVVVKYNSIEDYFCIDNVPDKTWSDAGEYTITLVNRLGYSYSFSVKINESNYSIKISGEGTDGVPPILYSSNQMVNLPLLNMYGYNLVGYKTSDGNVLSGEVEAIALKGYAALETVWEAKQYNLTMFIGDDQYYTQKVSFGETYNLMSLASLKDNRFKGWSSDEINTIQNLTINDEGDIVLYALFEGEGPTQEEIDEMIGQNKDSSDESDDGFTWWQWVLIILGGIIALILVILLIVGIFSFFC